MTAEDIDKELEDFYLDLEESSKCLKLLLEFDSSNYNYKGVLFEIPKNSKKKITKSKEINLSKDKDKNTKLF
jgi:hypothetical protein